MSPRAALFFATSNRGKLDEARAFLGPLGYDVRGLAESGLSGEVEESGATFAENARIKALAWSLEVPGLVLADDSGLEVDALDGAPGVRSARYGGPALDDAGRNRKLLEALTGVPRERRGARFVCVLALVRDGRVVAEASGERRGRILEEPRGAAGFGYDPLFLLPELGLSFAELGVQEKLAESHRGRAFANLRGALDQGWSRPG